MPMPMPDSEGAGGADIQAVSRARRILSLFNVERSELVTAEVAEALRLNRTTTHRYLTSMAAVGLLAPGSRHSSYVIGPLATRLGAIATCSTPVLAIAPPYLQALSDELETTVTLSLWASTGAMVVHGAEPRTAGAILTVRLGTVLPMGAAQSQVFRAWLDADRAASAEAEQVREAGYAIVRHPEGIQVIAAPVFDAHGLCAAAGIVALSGTLTDAATPLRSRRLREMSDQLSVELGANGGGQPPVRLTA